MCTRSAARRSARTTIVRRLSPCIGSVFEHAYSEPSAPSILPPTTMAAWSSSLQRCAARLHRRYRQRMLVREDMQFFAPAPVSIKDTDAAVQTIAHDPDTSKESSHAKRGRAKRMNPQIGGRFCGVLVLDQCSGRSPPRRASTGLVRWGAKPRADRVGTGGGQRPATHFA